MASDQVGPDALQVGGVGVHPGGSPWYFHQSAVNTPGSPGQMASSVAPPSTRGRCAAACGGGSRRCRNRRDPPAPGGQERAVEQEARDHEKIAMPTCSRESSGPYVGFMFAWVANDTW